MHRSYKRMLKYDLIKNHGCNWADRLSKYESLINDTPKEELQWMTPFRVFFHRSKKFNEEKLSRKEIKERVIAATKRVNQRTIRQQEKKLKTPVYHNGDGVFVKSKQSSKLDGISVQKGIVTEANYDRYKYKIAMECGEQWVDVRNLMCSTIEVQKKRLERQPDVLSAFNHRGFNLTYNPLGNGNCQFEALANQLRGGDETLSGAVLRTRVVEYLISTSTFGDQTNTRWDELITETRQSYLQRMAEDGCYGDAVTLQAVSSLLNTQIIVISSLNNGNTVITPHGGNNIVNLERP